MTFATLCGDSSRFSVVLGLIPAPDSVGSLVVVVKSNNGYPIDGRALFGHPDLSMVE